MSLRKVSLHKHSHTPTLGFLCCVGLLLCLSGCKLGFQPTDDSDGDGDDSDDPTTSVSFIGTGADSTWLLDITDNESFDLALKPQPDGTLRVSVDGDYEDLSSGFSRLRVRTANGANAPALETSLPALRLDDHLFLLRHWDNSGRLLPFIPDGGCPTQPFTANWIQLGTPANDLANDAATPFFGVLSHNPVDEEIAITHRHALTEEFPDLGAAEDLATGACEEGFAQRDDDHFFFADNGTALINRNIGTSEESLWLALPDTAISAADLDGSYIGFWMDNGRAAGDRLWSVTMECAAGDCPVKRITDISNLNSLSNQGFQIELDEEALDQPQPGFIPGTTETFIEAITYVRQLACIASDDFNNTGSKLLVCVGQSPFNIRVTVSGFFIAQD